MCIIGDVAVNSEGAGDQLQGRRRGRSRRRRHAPMPDRRVAPSRVEPRRPLVTSRSEPPDPAAIIPTHRPRPVFHDQLPRMLILTSKIHKVEPPARAAQDTSAVRTALPPIRPHRLLYVTVT